jgi:hypothetical protein
LDEVVEALEDGADIDFGSGTPLFVAISEGLREVVALLVERGADVTVFGLEVAARDGEVETGGDEGGEGETECEGEPGDVAGEHDEGTSEREELIDALLALVRSAKQEEPKASEDDPVDAKVVRAFDRMIRNKGLGEPIAKKRLGEYGVFVEGLKWIAAEECELVVVEFLEAVELVRGEKGEKGMPVFLAENDVRIRALSERYVLAEEVPGELLREYMKERKERKEQAKGEEKAQG